MPCEAEHLIFIYSFVKHQRAHSAIEKAKASTVGHKGEHQVYVLEPHLALFNRSIKIIQSH